MSLAEKLAEVLGQPPKVLTLDIETSPHLAWSFSLWNTTISPDMIVEPSRVLCFAAKWLTGSKVMLFSEWEHGHDEMIRQAHRLIDECDILVTYNGPGFDEKHLAREFIMAGLKPPSPYQQVDLLKTTRGRFKFPSNRLGYVGDTLDIGTKLETGGWRLWQGVLAGDEKARKKFGRYCKQDVALTESLFRVLAPWIKSLPHAGLWTGDLTSCYLCGGHDLAITGVVRSKTNAWIQLRCDCGAINKMMPSGQTRQP